MTDQSQSAERRPHQRMIYPDQKIAELIAENARLKRALNAVTQCLDSVEMIECAKEALEEINDAQP